MRPILIAVAVHDEHEARLEPALPRQIRVVAGEPLQFRISYRLADNSDRREEATVRGEVTIGRHPPVRGETAMHDRPLLDDTRAGNIVFSIPGLDKGRHKASFSVHMETSDADIASRDPPLLQDAEVHAEFEIKAE